VKAKKTLKIIWEIIKAIYAIAGVLIILPASVIIAAAVVVQKKIMKKFRNEKYRP